MSLLDWLEWHVGDKSPRGRLATRLITARSESSARHRLHGEDVAAVLEFAAKHPKLSPMLDVIRAAEPDRIRSIIGAG